MGGLSTAYPQSPKVIHRLIHISTGGRYLCHVTKITEIPLDNDIPRISTTLCTGYPQDIHTPTLKRVAVHSRGVEPTPHKLTHYAIALFEKPNPPNRPDSPIQQLSHGTVGPTRESCTLVCMAASDHVSPEQLRKIAERVHSSHFGGHDLASPEHARDMCDTCSNVFLRDSGLPNAKGQWYEGADDQGYYRSHKVVHVPTTQGPHVVDMALNQFESAPVPLVEPLSMYEKRSSIKNLKRDDTNDDYSEWLERNS